MNSLAPRVHGRLLRRSRWRVAALGALIVMVVLAALSTGAYMVVRSGIYARLQERLERAAERTAGTDDRRAGIVDERGYPLAEVSRGGALADGPQGFGIVVDPRLGALAILRERSAAGQLRVVATPAQEQLQALAAFLRVLIALTLTGGSVALPVGYALAGLALRPLDQAVRERNEFVALASHQLRTPLSVIRTSAELAQAGRGVTPGEALGGILTQTRRMEALAARLTALARAESSAWAGPGSRTDLGAVVQQVAADLAPAARQRGVTIHVEAESVWTAAEPGESADMLTAILENAVQFSREGAAVSVSVRRHGSHVAVETRDAGPGIAPEDLPHVTTPFYQGRRTHGGYGLGLAIARAIAERRGGRLSITSVPGQGTLVRVTLPARPATTSRDGSEP